MTKVAELKEGDVLAFRSSGFWSAAIRFRTQSRVSHVGFYTTHKGRPAVIESRERIGVRIYPLEAYLNNPALRIDHYELLDGRYGVDRECLIDGCLESWGHRYASCWQFLRSWGMVTSRFADWIGLPPDTAANRWHCSEFVVRKLQDVCPKESIWYDKPPARWSPGDVVELPLLHPTGRVER